MAKYITIRFTREQAISQGLLTCECGWPANNHFNYTDGCAHDSNCKKYREKARVGTIIKPKKKAKPDKKYEMGGIRSTWRKD